MSAGVDVLAVIDAVLTAAAQDRKTTVDGGTWKATVKLREARAAVAELIAADEALQRIRREGASHAEHEASIRAHDAALARVGGAA